MSETEKRLKDHARLLWRDDVEGICETPDLCFEYGTPVRCSPCAIKQSQAAGVEVYDSTHSHFPEVCRLNRALAQERQAHVETKALLEKALETLGFYADPETYHACSFLFDPPTGGFDEDFGQEHDHEDYDRAMPGKMARETIRMIESSEHVRIDHDRIRTALIKIITDEGGEFAGDPARWPIYRAACALAGVDTLTQNEFKAICEQYRKNKR